MKKPPHGEGSVERPFDEIAVLFTLADRGCAANGISREAVWEFRAFCADAPSADSRIRREQLARLVWDELAQLGITTLPEAERAGPQALLDKVRSTRRYLTLMERALSQPTPAPAHPLALETKSLLIWCEHACATRVISPSVEAGGRRTSLADLRNAFDQRGWLTLPELQALLDMYDALLGAFGKELQGKPLPVGLRSSAF